MIYTPVSNIQGIIDGVPELSSGMRFLQLLRDQGLVSREQGYFPAILGGAVRNGIFLGSRIADIDIFIFKSNRDAVTSITHPSNGVALDQIREGLLSWLEDEEIEYRSLLSDAAANYDNEGNRFLDIIEFYWESFKFQILIPEERRTSVGFESLLGTMPVHSKVGLTLDYLGMVDIAMADYCAPRGHRIVASDLDLRYISIKYPNHRLLTYPNASCAVHSNLSDYVTSSSQGGFTFEGIASNNAARALVKRAFIERVGILNETEVVGLQPRNVR